MDLQKRSSWRGKVFTWISSFSGFIMFKNVIQSIGNVFHVLHHTENTSYTLWIRTHHITALYIASQTLNNFNFNYFTIIHSYHILYYIIIQE
jgi:hypothetical protein